MEKIKAAVVGYGNIGKYVVEALQVSPDFEIAGIVRRNTKEIPEELKDKCPKFWEGDMRPNDFFKEKEMWGFKYLEYTDPETNTFEEIKFAQ